jgi:Mg2+ and Co2+ transporter CorA
MAAYSDYLYCAACFGTIALTLIVWAWTRRKEWR